MQDACHPVGMEKQSLVRLPQSGLRHFGAATNFIAPFWC
jgi:hypothetical protein